MTDYNNDPALVKSHAELVEALRSVLRIGFFGHHPERDDTWDVVDEIHTALRNAEKLMCKNSASYIPHGNTPRQLQRGSQ